MGRMFEVVPCESQVEILILVLMLLFSLSEFGVV